MVRSYRRKLTAFERSVRRAPNFFLLSTDIFYFSIMTKRQHWSPDPCQNIIEICRKSFQNNLTWSPVSFNISSKVISQYVNSNSLLNCTSMGQYIYDIQEKCPIFAPPPPFFYVCTNGSKLGETPHNPGRWNLGYHLSVWNTYRHQSVTLITDTCLEHCPDFNNTYTNYSSGHSISVDPRPLPLPL